MNRLNQLFESKKGEILSVYFTAGYPAKDDTIEIIELLEESGADIIEIGIPFSDPVADGPTIQESNKRALQNGMSLKLLFEQLKGIRERIHTPLVMMGYLNPVVRMGVERFCELCAVTGIDALIIPDMPVQEYNSKYRETFARYGLSNIFLITPQTSEERIRQMDEATDTFIYMVSSPGITGAKKGISESQIAYFQRIRDMNLKHPALIGFGISDHNSFTQSCKYGRGAIIGSAFIDALSAGKKLTMAVPDFIHKILGR